MHSTAFRNDEQEQSQIELATTLLTSALAGVPSTLGKLAWISSFRVPGSDQYAHPTFAGVVPHEVAVRASRSVHKCLFADWLSKNLEEQHKDRAEYLESLPDAGEQKARLRRNWERLVPHSARKPDRLLFETDLSVVMELTEERASAAS
jgi:hypothetical protein